MKNWILKLPLREISEVADQKNFDPLLIASIVSVESDGDHYASRYEDHYRWLVDPDKFAKENQITYQTEVIFQKTSFGLMQVMGANFREMGYPCNLSTLASRKRLALEYGVDFFKKLVHKYDSIDDALSAYNQGTPRKNALGEYQNQHYVDKINERYEYLKRL